MLADTTVRSIVLAWSLCAIACGGPQKKTEVVTSSKDPISLYPLRTLAAWSYDVTTSESLSSTLAVTRVVKVEGNRVEVTSGSESIMYEIHPQGIFKAQSQSWLLKAPIELGATWRSGPDLEARVTSVNKEIETSAGHFNQCVEVQEQDFFASRVIRSTYCPKVGPVWIDVVTAKLRDHPTLNQARVTAKLRGYQ